MPPLLSMGERGKEKEKEPSPAQQKMSSESMMLGKSKCFFKMARSDKEWRSAALPILQFRTVHPSLEVSSRSTGQMPFSTVNNVSLLHLFLPLDILLRRDEKPDGAEGAPSSKYFFRSVDQIGLGD